MAVPGVDRLPAEKPSTTPMNTAALALSSPCSAETGGSPGPGLAKPNQLTPGS
jgi:hypothetical protein